MKYCYFLFSIMALMGVALRGDTHSKTQRNFEGGRPLAPVAQETVDSTRPLTFVIVDAWYDMSFRGRLLFNRRWERDHQDASRRPLLQSQVGVEIGNPASEQAECNRAIANARDMCRRRGAIDCNIHTPPKPENCRGPACRIIGNCTFSLAPNDIFEGSRSGYLSDWPE